MNCKPGDLAVVFRVKSQRDEFAIGALLRVISLACYSPPAWHFEPLSRNLPPPDRFAVLDEILRPIRGDEQTQENERTATV